MENSPLNFLDRWMEYTETLESPRSFDKWTGLWMLSHTFRDVRINHPRRRINLTTFILLITDRGVGQTDILINDARRICDTSWGYKDVQTITSFSEFSPTSSLISPDITRAMKAPTLQQVDYVENGMLTFISVATPQWVNKNIPPDVLEGGLASTAMFIAEDTPKRVNAWPSEDSQRRSELVSILQTLRNRLGDCRVLNLTEGAIARYSNWYSDRPGARTSSQQPLFARSHEWVLRLSGLLCLNQGRQEITADDVSAGIAIYQEQARITTATVVPTSKEEDRLATGIEKIRHVLAKAKGERLTRRTLYAACRYFFPKPKLFDLVCTILHEMRVIEIEESTFTRNRFYSAGSLITARHLEAAILRRVEEGSLSKSHST